MDKLRSKLQQKLAERKGFEPPTHCCEHAFQASALNHSATSPKETFDTWARKYTKANFKSSNTKTKTQSFSSF